MSRTGLWDSHAHLDSDYFTSDRHELITNLQAELDGIVNPGCDAETSAFAVELAEKYDIDVLMTTPYADIRRVAENTKNLIVLAPYMDTLRPGRGMAANRL